MYDQALLAGQLLDRVGNQKAMTLGVIGLEAQQRRR